MKMKITYNDKSRCNKDSGAVLTVSDFNSEI